MPPRVWAKVESWLYRMLKDLICVRDEGVDCDRHRPHTLVIGNAELYPEYQGRVYDFRDLRGGCAKVLDFHAPLELTLNADFFRSRLANYPNQRILSFILEGVRYQADVELQTVLTPHLLSLANGFDSVVKELKRMSSSELRWYTAHADFPFWPMYSLGEGAVPRKLENRWRRCEEGGGPRQECFDASGVRALSLNEASKSYHMPAHFTALAADAEWAAYLRARGLPATAEMELALQYNRGTKWERQRMPTLDKVGRDLAVLSRAALLLNEGIFVLGDDVKDYFSHLNNAAEELHKVNTIFLSEPDALDTLYSVEGGSLSFISQKQMGFGLHPNSIIAQEFSEVLNDLFREDVDAVEDPIAEADPRPSMQRWLEVRRGVEREHGGHQRRLYSIWMYCDDNIIIVVGAARAVRLIRAWRRLTEGAGLIMAIPEKRTLGTWCTWVGALIFAGFGFIVIPKSKLVRAAMAVRQLLQDGLQFDEYRSLLGLLEHFRCIARLPRRLMHHLYDPHARDGVGAEGPNAMVFLTIFMESQFKRWLDLLNHCGGCTVLAFLRRASVAARAQVENVFVASSDAATDSSPPGMGGFMHGLYWYLEVADHFLDYLHITVLELLAAAINAVVFERAVPPHSRLLLQTDASAAYYTLAFESAKSKVLIFVHQRLMGLPAVRRALERCDIGMIAGDGNIVGDAVSRGPDKAEVLREVAAQLRLRLTQLEVPTLMRQLVDDTYEYARGIGARVNRDARRPPSPPLPMVLEHETRPRAEGTRERPLEFDGYGLGNLELLPRPSDASAPPMGPSSSSFLSQEVIEYYVSLAASLRARKGKGQKRPAAAAPCPPPAGTSYESLASSLKRRRGTGHGKGGEAASAASSDAMPASMRSAPAGGINLAASALARNPSGKLSLLEQDIQLEMTSRARMVAGPGASDADVERVGQGLLRAAHLTRDGASIGTLEKDDHAYDYWASFCEAYGFPRVFSREVATQAPDVIASRLGLFLLWAYPQIKGRERPDAKPRTVLNNYPGAIVRIFQRDFKLPMPRQKHWEGEVKGLLRSYQRIYGTLALSPRRRQPMTRVAWRRLEDLSSGTALPGRQPWMADRHSDLTILRLGRFLWKSGHRLGEIVQLYPGEISHLTREHVTYKLSNRIVIDPSDAELRAAGPGDLVWVAPSASKPDQFGEIHCSFPTVLEFDGTPTCAAASIRDIELERPCHGTARRTQPLFANAGGGAYSYATLNKMLHDLLVAVFGSAVAATLSWHSFRIGLACALRAVDCPDEIIQLICRWQSKESLQVYAQLGTTANASWLRKAAAVNVEGVRTANMPQLDHADQYAELINPDTPATRRARAARAVEPETPAPLGPAILTAGETIEVQWGTTWFKGTFTSSRSGVGYDGQPTRLYRILYDAAGSWRVQSKWHDLSEENWRRC